MYISLNPSNAELNPICHLLALLEAHHILHVSRVRVNFVEWESVYFFLKNVSGLEKGASFSLASFRL